MNGTVGGVSPSVSVTYFCALAASRRENVCASSVSVLTKSIALLNNSIALSRLPLQENVKNEKGLKRLHFQMLVLLRNEEGMI